MTTTTTTMAEASQETEEQKPNVWFGEELFPLANEELFWCRLALALAKVLI